MHMHNKVHGHASPIQMYATHMCNGCTTYKMQWEWCIRYSCYPTVIPCEARLNKEVKSERKYCPSFNRRHTARNPLNQKRALVKRSNPRMKPKRLRLPMVYENKIYHQNSLCIKFQIYLSLVTVTAAPSSGVQGYYPPLENLYQSFRSVLFAVEKIHRG
ncbi:hypothetical protein EVAR_4883_1 [Eumeta japonica]|uniref:Uncharacterized protein n=1 Tax=Eumeta variegata TaxID=151549 RepID=A0A4C1T265_EUMVA|nr:hypothetical protein EVAR_4883_1 [Eumeta japonica]